MSKTPYILFDIGVVLLHLDFGKAAARSAPLCDPDRVANCRQFLSLMERDPLVNDYERGELTAREFYGHFVERTGFRGTFEDFTEIWRSIFSENVPMLSFAAGLAKERRIYFLTNASDLHVPWIFARFPSLRFFTDYACSCYLGASKPDRAFYDKALARFNIRPQECVFVDDMPENVKTAEALGIRSVLYTDPAKTIAALRDALRLT